MTGVNRDLVGELVGAGVARHEARWLVEEFVPGGDLDALEALRRAAARRVAGEPLQYILGHWPFRSLDLDVDARVLIPRPETEELVSVALRELASSGAVAPTIVDLGCGSGAIGFALVRELAERGILATLVAVDQSSGALEVARRNALKHGLTSVSFVQSSWFTNLDSSLRGRVDLLVANPPYVSADEMEELDDVLGYEPRDALVAADTRAAPGFADAAFIIQESFAWLADAGRLIVEHGAAQGDAAIRAATNAGFASVNDYEDLAGRPRVLVARRS